jgi:hypothetical protein
MAETEEIAGGAGHFGAFMRRHSRTLQSVGVLLFLSTFIVRDVLREGVKDFLGNLNSARSTFAVRGDLGRIREQIEQLIKDKDQRQQREPEAFSEARTLGDLSMLEQSTYAVINSADTLCNLAKAMSDAGDRERACAMVESSTAFARRLSKARDDVGRLRGADVSAQRSALCEKLANEYYGVANSVDFGGQPIIERAGKEQEENEGRYRLLSVVYYGLFMIGLTLGAVGTFFGIKGVGVGA